MMADFTDPEHTRSHRLAARSGAAQDDYPFVEDEEPRAGESPFDEEPEDRPRRARKITAPPAADPKADPKTDPKANPKTDPKTETPQGAATQADAPKKAARRPAFRLEEYAGQVLSGNILTRAEVRRQYPYIFFMALLMLLYIANGYHIQKLHRRHDKLTEQIKELRSRSLTLSSIRMTATRQSEIIKELDARGIPLRESLSPPKVIEK